MKILVTTCNFGSSYFPEYTKQISDNQITIHQYTDNNYPSRSKSLQPRMKGKLPKMMEWYFNPGYDYYIWMDSRFEISTEKSIDWFVEQCGNNDICLFKHPSRSRIKDEANHVIALLDSPYIKDRYEGENIENQVDRYLLDRAFEDKELFACGLFIYRCSLIANKEHNLMTSWLLHNTLYSIQDQLSLPYLLQKHKVKYKALDINIFDCKQFQYR